MNDFIVVLTSTDNKSEAEKITQALVEKRLAASAKIMGPASSIYWWKGKIERASEWQCIIKPRRSHFDAVEAQIRQMHSYEVAEIIALPAIDASAEYLAWWSRQTEGE